MSVTDHDIMTDEAVPQCQSSTAPHALFGDAGAVMTSPWYP